MSETNRSNRSSTSPISPVHYPVAEDQSIVLNDPIFGDLVVYLAISVSIRLDPEPHLAAIFRRALYAYMVGAMP
jgi:hypothetical protein